MGFMNGMYGGYHWLWMLIWLGFWIVIVMGLVFLIRALIERKSGAEKHAMDILNDRYARGDISREEYLEKRKDILGGP